MTKAMDILKELEDIGAVGDKIQQPTIRRARPIQVPLAIEVPPPLPPSRIQTREVLSGFAEQLETLEGALHGMLEWCAAAREELLASEDIPQEEPEAPEASEAVDEDTEAEAESLAAPAPPEAPLPPSTKPRLSLEEIRKHFLDPTFQAEAEKPNGNGASTLEVPAAPTTETEKAHG